MKKISYDFKNRTAIVTGGAQGFGLDISKRLLESGASVIIWDNDSKATEKAIKDLDLSISFSMNMKLTMNVKFKVNVTFKVNVKLKMNVKFPMKINVRLK